MTRRDDVAWLGPVALVYTWSAFLIAGALALGGCATDPWSSPDLPRTGPCAAYESQIVSVDVDVTPSITPAPKGIRIIVPDSDFRPLMGASWPVPGGRMVWVVWLYRWYDGDHIGTIGRLGDTSMCQWYDPA
jgi:hypothetical protein